MSKKIAFIILLFSQMGWGSGAPATPMEQLITQMREGRRNIPLLKEVFIKRSTPAPTTSQMGVLLIQAARFNDILTINLILKSPYADQISLNQTPSLTTAMTVAAGQGYIEAAQAILNHNPYIGREDINSKEILLKAALERATKKGQVSFVQYFLTHFHYTMDYRMHLVTIARDAIPQEEGILDPVPEGNYREVIDLLQNLPYYPI